MTLDDEYLAEARRDFRDDGTTLILAMAHGDKITVANVGDSRAILVTGDGTATQGLAAFPPEPTPP